MDDNWYVPISNESRDIISGNFSCHDKRSPCSQENQSPLQSCQMRGCVFTNNCSQILLHETEITAAESELE